MYLAFFVAPEPGLIIFKFRIPENDASWVEKNLRRPILKDFLKAFQYRHVQIAMFTEVKVLL